MQLVTVDLTKDPEVAALLADKQPGDRVYACFSVKSQDAQSASLRLSGMAATREELSSPDAEGDDEDEEAAAAEGDDEEGEPKAPPAKPEPSSRGKRIADMMTARSDGM